MAAEDIAAATESPSKATAEAAAGSAGEALLACPGAGELYARLLCEFEPAAVLPFLQARAPGFLVFSEASVGSS